MTKSNNMKRGLMISTAAPLIFLTLLSGAALGAQQPAGGDNADISELRKELAEIRRLQQTLDARIEEITAIIEQPSTSVEAETTPVYAAAAPAQPLAPPAVAENTPKRLEFSGDLRLRYEGNFANTTPDRNRAVLRARLRAAYHLNDWLMIGGRIGTGDPDDPNSDDVTVSSFVDDFKVSLDEIYASATFGEFSLYGGKFPLPFQRTDLVWDGDVSPQGAAVKYHHAFRGGSIDAAGLYYVIDESAAGPDSAMRGAQLGVHMGEDTIVSLDASVAYVDYALNSLAGADAGDFRSNLLAANGDYLSDFNLLNVIVGATYRGLGPRWPLRLSADYVKNFGSYTDEDTGLALAVSAGRTSQLHDARFGYQYMTAETDAVFAAFSHDNLALATNYEQHALTADYVLDQNLLLNATYYRYRALASDSLGLDTHGDWLDRLRLNAVVKF